ncbi:hypothetical protein M378DRAFT_155464 [Amanita muscaria Koide BX008]|uniref:Uncharacterized protein n=1 Tax=Amanita muscaria (strain Koide BX008) TaxID=946122 RepID=A0A0C2XQB7_AMAMK|nr:hypothetical protein M378DRAFT_155464 [Amanita muscaria Koide BX008]
MAQLRPSLCDRHGTFLMLKVRLYHYSTLQNFAVHTNSSDDDLEEIPSRSASCSGLLFFCDAEIRPIPLGRCSCPCGKSGRGLRLALPGEGRIYARRRVDTASSGTKQCLRTIFA